MDEREGLASALVSAEHKQTQAMIRWSFDTNPATDHTPPRLVDQQIAAILSSDWLAAHDREVAAKALDLTPAELLHLAADLQQDTRAKIGPRLTGAQKVIDAAQAIIRSSTPSTETNEEQRG